MSPLKNKSTHPQVDLPDSYFKKCVTGKKTRVFLCLRILESNVFQRVFIQKCFSQSQKQTLTRKFKVLVYCCFSMYTLDLRIIEGV